MRHVLPAVVCFTLSSSAFAQNDLEVPYDPAENQVPVDDAASEVAPPELPPTPTSPPQASPVAGPVAPEPVAEPVIAAAPADPPAEPASVETAAGTTLEWSPGLETFAAYRLQLFAGPDGQQWFHTFDLERTLVWLGARYGDMSARVMLEGVQSADEAGLLAVGGDSMVIRVREAWASYDIRGWVDVHAGIVRTLTQPEVESVEQLRPVGKGPHERFNLLYPADLGGTVTLNLPSGYGRIGAGMYNGESYRARELNRGKTTEFFASIHPLASIAAARPLTIAGSYILGSEGAGRARADRATAILAWQSDWLRVGASFSYALGFEGNGARQGWMAHGFARAVLLDRLILGARAYHFARSTSDNEDALTTIQGTVGAIVMKPLEAYLSLTRNLAGERARAAIPGSDGWELTVLVRARLDAESL